MDDDGDFELNLVDAGASLKKKPTTQSRSQKRPVHNVQHVPKVSNAPVGKSVSFSTGSDSRASTETTSQSHGVVNGSRSIVQNKAAAGHTDKRFAAQGSRPSSGAGGVRTAMIVPAPAVPPAHLGSGAMIEEPDTVVQAVASAGQRQNRSRLSAAQPAQTAASEPVASASAGRPARARSDSDSGSSSGSSSDSDTPLPVRPAHTGPDMPMSRLAARTASSASTGTSRPAAGAARVQPAAGAARVQPAPSAPQAPFKILSYDIDGDGSASAAGPGSGPQAFLHMGLDKRLVDKLTTAPGDGKAMGAHAMTTAPSFGGAGSGSVAAVSGVVRGHLRDGFGLSRPTRVQQLVLPLAIAGKSLVVKSETGSGKTLAFCLPVLHHLLQEHASSTLHRGSGTRAIIISPTRELCAQIFGVLSRICQPFHFIVPGLLAGGEKRKSEKARLRKGCTIVVATPGRLLDHLKMTEAFQCDAQTVRWLVLDEADRLLDMGFGQQVMGIVDELEKRRKASSGGTGSADVDGNGVDRRTLLVSATVSNSVRELAQSILASDAVFVDASVAGAIAEKKKASAVPAPDAAATTTSAGTRSADATRADETVEEAKEGKSAGAEGGAGIDADADKAEVSVLPEQAVYTAPKTLTQAAMLVPLKWRLVTLLGVLVHSVRKARSSAAQARAKAGPGQHFASHQHTGAFKAILFLSSTNSVDFHASLLSTVLPYLVGGAHAGVGRGGDAEKSGHRQSRFPVFRLHGNVAQSDRTTTYRAFAACECGLLVASDVAARGLDLPAVDLIIQADAPSETGEYVHRIGRTARRGAKGSALLVLQPHESAFIGLLGAAGLSVHTTDSGPHLASLADLKIPLHLAAHPSHVAKASAAAARASAARDAAMKDDDDAHSGSEGASNENAKYAKDKSKGKQGTLGRIDMGALSASMSSGPRTGVNDAEEEEEEDGEGGPRLDPDTGVPVRLLHLVQFAEDIRRKSAPGRAAGHAAAGVVSSAGTSLPSSAIRAVESNAVAWQYWLEEIVIHRLADLDASTGRGVAGPSSSAAASTPLLSLARQAFTSFVRAYSTHEKSVRHIFNSRNLHLGHAAKAFGLREQPGAASKEAARDRHRAEEEAAQADDAQGWEGEKRGPDHVGSRARHTDNGKRSGQVGQKRHAEPVGQDDKRKKSRLHFAAPGKEDRVADSRGTVDFGGASSSAADRYGGGGDNSGTRFAAKGLTGQAKRKAQAMSEFDS